MLAARLIAVNKSDLIKDKRAFAEELNYKLETQFSQIKAVPVVYLSALNKENIHQVIEDCFIVYKAWNRRLTTGQINKWLSFALEQHPLPLMKNGKRLRIKYATQIKTRPPQLKIEWCMSYLRLNSGSIFEIIALYMGVLLLQTMSLSSSEVPNKLNVSGWLLDPHYYRAIWLLISLPMVMSVWIYHKVKQVNFDSMISMFMLQAVMIMLLHNQYYLSYEIYRVLIGAGFVTIMSVFQMLQLRKTSTISAALLLPYCVWVAILCIILFRMM